MNLTGFEIMLILVILLGCGFIAWIMYRLHWAEFNIKLLENQSQILRERLDER